MCPERQREQESISSQGNLLTVTGDLLWLCSLHLYRPDSFQSAFTPRAILLGNPGRFAWLVIPSWRQHTGNNKMVTCTMKKQGEYKIKREVRMGLGIASWRQKHVRDTGRDYSLCFYLCCCGCSRMEGQHTVGTCWRWASPRGLQMPAPAVPCGPSVGRTSCTHQCSDYELRSWGPRSPTCHLCDLSNFLITSLSLTFLLCKMRLITVSSLMGLS